MDKLKMATIRLTRHKTIQLSCSLCLLVAHDSVFPLPLCLLAPDC